MVDKRAIFIFNGALLVIWIRFSLLFFVLFLVVSMTPSCAVQLQDNYNGDLKDYNMFEGKGWTCQFGHDLQLLGDRTIADGTVVIQTPLDTNNGVFNCGLLSTDNTKEDMVISISGSAIDSATGKPINISQSP